MDDGSTNLKDEIFSRSLEEFKAGSNEEGLEACVICLERIVEAATALPCRHHNFDFLCLLSWLEQQNKCPLCKTIEEYCFVTSADYRSGKSVVQAVDYTDPAGNRKHYEVPGSTSSTGRCHQPLLNARPRRDGFARRSRPRFDRPQRRPSPDTALQRRRRVYRHQLYSLHVGSSRQSAYQDLTPQRVANTPALVSRARAWIRRELQVFSFLDVPVTSPVLTPLRSSAAESSPELSLRNIGNAEFLLEYIIAIIKTVDIKDSTGQAEDMVSEFLGRENARLFLHELECWLRSPYEDVIAWDQHVQYPQVRRHDEASEAVTRKRVGSPHPDPAAFVSRSSSQHPERRSKRRWLDRYVPD